MGGIGVRQALSPEYYPERNGDDDELYEDIEDEQDETEKKDSSASSDNDGNENIPDEVLAEVEKELEEKFKDYPKGMGFCHTYWYHKKQALAARGYSWMSPQDLADQNPHSITFFD